MAQQVLALLLVAGAAVYLVHRRFSRSTSQKPDCAAGCQCAVEKIRDE